MQLVPCSWSLHCVVGQCPSSVIAIASCSEAVVIGPASVPAWFTDIAPKSSGGALCRKIRLCFAREGMGMGG